MKFQINFGKEEKEEAVENIKATATETFNDFSYDHPILIYGGFTILTVLLSYKISEHCLSNAIYKADMRTLANVHKIRW